MASRGSSPGAIITIVILGILTVTFFVLTLMFYAEKNNLEAAAEDAVQSRDRFVAGGEVDRANAIADRAAAGKSVFAHMEDVIGRAARIAAGSRDISINDLEQRVADLDPERVGLLRIATNQRERIASLQSQIEEMRVPAAEESARLAAARAFFTDDATAVRRDADGIAQQQQQLSSQVTGYSGRIRDGIESIRRQEDETRVRVQQVRDEAENDKATLRNQVAQLDEQILRLEDEIRRLRDERRAAIIRPRNEFDLVDGSISSVQADQQEVTINLGRRDKIVLDMVFEVYESAAAIAPDPRTGEYAQGKAMIQVINVGEATSTARVVERRGRSQIFRGDVIANPVYDPRKQYRMLVFGHFDTDGDGRPTEFERDSIVARIREWGGEAINAREAADLTGDIDFLVLGQRPTVPPQPSSQAPIDIQLQWIRLNDQADLYDEFQRRAEAVGIPILSQNRLSTLLYN
ncbi:MAG: hypothetical protein JJU33_14620 [Phycisphaerales bacterium]|nr:hypothetical protein [Phycisphaerales bacterium]